jgi:catechol 2,3-dioxygenase-like lactoylglutathione lyase family enzyme
MLGAFRPKGEKMTGQAQAAMRGNHICISYPDYDAAIAWWRDKLGFRLGREFGGEDRRMCYMHPPGDDRTMIQLCADSRFISEPRRSIENGDDFAESFRHGGAHHYCFEVDDTDAAVANARAHGIKVVVGPVLFGRLNTKIAFFVDPWGNMFEFSQSMPG